MEKLEKNLSWSGNSRKNKPIEILIRQGRNLKILIYRYANLLMEYFSKSTSDKENWNVKRFTSFL